MKWQEEARYIEIYWNYLQIFLGAPAPMWPGIAICMASMAQERLRLEPTASEPGAAGTSTTARVFARKQASRWEGSLCRKWRMDTDKSWNILYSKALTPRVLNLALWYLWFLTFLSMKPSLPRSPVSFVPDGRARWIGTNFTRQCLLRPFHQVLAKMSVQHRIESTVKQLEGSNQARSMQIASSELGWIHFCRGMGKGASLTCSGSTTCYSARTATLLDAATSGIGLVHAQTVWPSGCKS